MTARVARGDNLEVLTELRAAGERFDLVELDGPYMAGLEDWDTLTEAQYIQHYADRLTIVRDLLQPWGVVFVFGYPEGCAEIKSWVHRTETLYLRRWLTWYKQVTAHKGRKVEAILLFTAEPVRRDVLEKFGAMLKQERLERKLSLRDVEKLASKDWWHRGGNFYFETGKNAPSKPDYQTLKHIFGFCDKWDVVINSGYILGNYNDLTDIDYIARTFPEDTENLNDDRLRSKPVQLYVDLFKPTIPPTETRRALVLYGGSGNAAIAAEALGYDTTVIELDPNRCELIETRAAVQVDRWRRKLSQLRMFENGRVVQPQQAAMFEG